MKGGITYPIEKAIIYKTLEFSIEDEINRRKRRETREKSLKTSKKSFKRKSYKLLGKERKEEKSLLIDRIVQFPDKDNKEKSRKEDDYGMRNIFKAHDHYSKIVDILVCSSFGMFLTIDERSIIKQRDLNTFKLLNSFYTHHYLDFDIFKEVIFYKPDDILLKEKKFNVVRERVIGSSISEDNGDYVICSENYISLYSVNNVLLAIYKVKQGHSNVV